MLDGNTANGAVYQIDELPAFENVTLIINVNTHLSTTLAVLSAKKHTDYPVVVIDCSTEENELVILGQLAVKIEFYLIKIPLKIHGQTLDLLFRSIKAKHILLLDSDAEITDFSWFKNELFNQDNCFGIGFQHGPCPMSDNSIQGGAKFCYYQERMFIPCVLLKRDKILEALDEGYSFEACHKNNDFPNKYIARILSWRLRLPFFRKNDIPFLKYFRRTYYEYYKPSVVYYDTGSKMHIYLKYKCGYDFIGLPAAYHDRYFNHYHGITRKILNPDDSNSSDLNVVENIIRNRLLDFYNFDFSLFEIRALFRN